MQKKAQSNATQSNAKQSKAAQTQCLNRTKQCEAKQFNATPSPSLPTTEAIARDTNKAPYIKGNSQLGSRCVQEKENPKASLVARLHNRTGCENVAEEKEVGVLIPLGN